MPVLVVFLVGVQVARDDFDSREPLTDRFGAISASIDGMFGSRGTESSIFASVLFTRVFEGTGQLVVDEIREGRKFVGLENFERLWFLFLPRIIAPEKMS